MNELRIFENAEFGSVRSILIDSVPWFVGKDVAEILGYSNTRKALLDHIDDDDKKDGVTIRDAIGREQTPVLINESGLYSLILRSQLPNARQFKKWVTSEVLPAIRKHGIYATDYLIANPDFAIAALTALKEERERNLKLGERLAIQKQQIAEMMPKATYYDIVLSCKDAVNISVIAKDYGLSAIRLNVLLHELGVQFKQNDIWLLYQKHASKGYTRTETFAFEGSSGEVRTKVHTKWTQKGRLFIYELLKSEGIVPQIEQEVSDD